ncbi:MAG: SDR family oxidoreductase [Spongiibacteraceae bacterium]|nr:SDR family oxidoreductase [Spongiibacteraceae bacterium]
MNAKKVLLVGCGDIGVPLGLLLRDLGAEVWGLRRNPAVLPKEIQAIKGDVTNLESLNNVRKVSFDYVVVTLTPADFSDEAYQKVYVQGLKNLLALLAQKQFSGHLLFISSTSVYHQSDGSWVDENSPVAPTSFSGRRLLEAEQVLEASAIASTVVRFAGIYGPGRRRLIEQVLAGSGCTKQPALYTNRIHRDDCVGFLAHLVVRHCDGGVLDKRYIGVDNKPATLWSVKRWLAAQLGVNADAMECLQQTRRASKRCSNQRMLSSGYQLLHPDYQSGYKKLVQNEFRNGLSL